MRITLPSGTPAELAHPTADSSGAAPTMGLVVAPDIFGLRPLFDDLAARLATEWNMVVCAVEPFPGRDLGPDVAERFAAVPGVADDDNLRDLLEAADVVAAAVTAVGGPDRVGLIGFCMGGMYCHKASRADRFARIASFYGMIRVPDAWQSPVQGEPLAHLTAGHADRVLAIIGDRDHYTPPADVEALAATGVQVVRYPDAEHGFAHDASRPAHRADDAADAFARTHAWLAG